MKVKIKISEVAKALGMNSPNENWIELEAEPVEERPEWINKLHPYCMDESTMTESHIKRSSLEHFIRQEILTKFAEECKSNLACTDPEGFENRCVNEVLKRWLGGKV